MRSSQCTPMLILPCYHSNSVQACISAISHMSHFQILGHAHVCSCALLNSSPLGSPTSLAVNVDNVTGLTKGEKTTSVPLKNK